MSEPALVRLKDRTDGGPASYRTRSFVVNQAGPFAFYEDAEQARAFVDGRPFDVVATGLEEIREVEPDAIPDGYEEDAGETLADRLSDDEETEDDARDDSEDDATNESADEADALTGRLAALTVDDLEDLSYNEMQSIASDLEGLHGNMSADDLEDGLRERLEEAE